MKKIVALLGLLFASTSNAAIIELEPKATDVDGGSIIYSNLATPTVTATDAIFSLSIAGDFDNNNSSESVLVTIDGYSLGRIFDNDVNNDVFDFVGDDYIGDHGNMLYMSGTATIEQSIWANIIADGLVNITFDLSTGVNCCSNPHAFTSGNIRFSEVAEPASMGLFLLGFAALASSRKRRLQIQ
jgi:hypothetical protein